MGLQQLEDIFSILRTNLHDWLNKVVPKVCCADPTGPTTSSQAIRRYISVMATLKFTYFLLNELIEKLL